MSEVEKKRETGRLWSLFANNWLLGMLILLVGIDICCHISYSVVESENIVLLFVGILATFVVVSNYIQVKEAERKFEYTSENMREDFNDKINDLNTDINQKFGEIVKAFKEDGDRLQGETVLLTSITHSIFTDDYDAALFNTFTLLRVASKEDAENKYLPTILLYLKHRQVVLKLGKDVFLREIDGIGTSGKDMSGLIEFINNVQTK